MQWVNKLSKAGTNLNASLKSTHSKHAKNAQQSSILQNQFSFQLLTVSLHKCFTASRHHNFVVNSVPLEQMCAQSTTGGLAVQARPLYWLAQCRPDLHCRAWSCLPRASLLSLRVHSLSERSQCAVVVFYSCSNLTDQGKPWCTLASAPSGMWSFQWTFLNAVP